MTTMHQHISKSLSLSSLCSMDSTFSESCQNISPHFRNCSVGPFGLLYCPDISCAFLTVALIVRRGICLVTSDESGLSPWSVIGFLNENP